MNENAISLQKLTFNFGKLRVIDDISLDIPKGLSFGLLGSNGAGKTTLIRLMVGLLKPLSGNVSCLEKKPSTATAKEMGYMPQIPALYNELTVAQNIDFFAHIYGLKEKKERTQRVDETIKVVDLWPKRNVQIMKLSGGMKQRVSLACAIVHNPQLIFLDEPTVGLDPELRVHFWEYFSKLTKQGNTLIISSHTMDDAAHCDRLVFLRQGKVIANGTPVDLRKATGKADANLEDAFLYFIRKEGGSDNVN
jgi:ABC-2 type transport system ATP-binding protein